MLIKYSNERQLQPLGLLCNTEDSEVFSNVSANDKLGLSVIDEYPPNTQPAIICGGGPSLADTLVNIRALKATGGKVFALNNAARYLAEHGIKPDAQIIIDPRAQNVEFVSEPWADEVLLCSQCHPSLFEKCQEIGYPVRLWHPSMKNIEKHIEDKKALLVSVTLSVGLSCLSLIHCLGHREFHLFGYDSSHKDDKSHAYEQPMNQNDEIVRAVVESNVFYSSIAMAGQANDFKQVTSMLESFGTTIQVYGSGLVPFLWKQWQAEKTIKVLTAYYDLGVSPASYDFLSFLVEAERYRLSHGFDHIDIVFQPGPMHGFRDVEIRIPEGGTSGELPDVSAQYGMLWGVCAPMARLLPSVRNVELLKKRKLASGDVFPEGYAENQPCSHYATAFLRGARPMLKAPEHTKRYVSRYGRYATITLRESAHWPTRNSNLSAWEEVARWLTRQGITPVFVPDAQALKHLSPFDYCDAAAWDLDVRAALYEGAVINLGVLNGPMSLAAYLDCRYLIFNIVVETAIASSSAFLKAHGFEEGDQFGGKGRLVWKPDTAVNIINELTSEIAL